MSRTVTLLALCAALGGCGGASTGGPETGAQLFSQACGACHSLVGRNSPSLQGGDLLGYRFGRAVMLEYAREMPVRRHLDAAQLRSVVDYVVAAENRAR
ncbi:MAG TPA: cytochrome c [Solirubrobacteraceae bacterium]|jgi:mono/diheme cytochrome c family protein|nr:cytochrome c [Solirubrobacteraceae bacterium]